MALKKEKVLKKLKLIFFEIFKNKKLKINFNSSANTIKNWDSLNHVILLLAIQEEFKIKFKISEYLKLNSFENIVKTIKSKKSQINEKV